MTHFFLSIILIKTITTGTFPFTNFASFNSSSFILRLTLSINYLCLPISYKKQIIFLIGIIIVFFEKQLTGFCRLYKPRDWYYFNQWIYFFTAKIQVLLSVCSIPNETRNKNFAWCKCKFWMLPISFFKCNINLYASFFYIFFFYMYLYTQMLFDCLITKIWPLQQSSLTHRMIITGLHVSSIQAERNQEVCSKHCPLTNSCLFQSAVFNSL